MQGDLFGESPVDPPRKRRPSAHEQRAHARRLRDHGIQRAVDHADSTTPRWSDRALAIARGYLADKAGERMTVERIRQFAEERGLPKPPDKRAWGAIAQQLAKAGLLRKVGWTTATDPRVHCNPISQWEVTPMASVNP